MKLTKNFTREEFDCHDGSVTPPEVIVNLKELANNLQVLRDHLGVGIHVNSGYRSPAYNAKLEGASKVSQHMKGKAADLVVEGMTPLALANVIEELIAEGKMKQGGIGIYPTFTHYDIRGIKARW